MAKKTIRVFKRSDGWAVKKDTSDRVLFVKRTQKEAYLAAREIALNQSLTITVYYPTGGIQKVITPQEKASDDGCFITTACVKYYGLKDDCYELQTLRNFRDNHLLKSVNGKKLVKKYYEIAPSIVIYLETDYRKKALFKTIFFQIKKACIAIENMDYEKASNIYKSVVTNLYNNYTKK